MSEKPPSGIPQYEAGIYPHIPEITGVTNSPAEIERRLHIVMDALPRLKTDWYFKILEWQQSGAGTSLDADTFAQWCRDLSLRPEVFTEWDDAYFNENVDDTIAIADERGSHPDQE